MEPENKRRKTKEGVFIDTKQEFSRLHAEILDNIIVQIETRFQNLDSFQFLELLNASKFQEYSQKFPEASLKSLANHYSDYFSTDQLRSELSVVYSRDAMRNKNIQTFLRYINDNNLQEVLPQVHKLCKLIATIPCTTASVERSFSTIKRIKTSARNTMSENRLSALALFAIEKKLLLKLKESDTFYERVTEEFVKNKERRMDFVYKH